MCAELFKTASSSECCCCSLSEVCRGKGSGIVWTLVLNLFAFILSNTLLQLFSKNFKPE
jgi:hypothetical protein